MSQTDEAAIQPLRISGFVVRKQDLIVALRPYVPNLADLRVMADGEHYWLVLSEGGEDDQAAKEEGRAG